MSTSGSPVPPIRGLRSDSSPAVQSRRWMTHLPPSAATSVAVAPTTGSGRRSVPGLSAAQVALRALLAKLEATKDLPAPSVVEEKNMIEIVGEQHLDRRQFRAIMTWLTQPANTTVVGISFMGEVRKSLGGRECMHFTIDTTIDGVRVRVHLPLAVLNHHHQPQPNNGQAKSAGDVKKETGGKGVMVNGFSGDLDNGATATMEMGSGHPMGAEDAAALLSDLSKKSTSDKYQITIAGDGKDSHLTVLLHARPQHQHQTQPQPQPQQLVGVPSVRAILPVLVAVHDRVEDAIVIPPPQVLHSDDRDGEGLYDYDDAPTATPPPTARPQDTATHK